MQEARKTTVRNRWGGTTGKMKGRGKRGEGTISLSLSIVAFSIPLFLLVVSHLLSFEYLLRGSLCLLIFGSECRTCCFFPAGAVVAAFSATVASSAVVVATSVVVATAVSSVAAVAEVGFFAGVAVCPLLLMKVLERFLICRISFR